MSNESEESLGKESSRKLLEQIRSLLVLQLRNSKVDDTAIGNILGIKAKSVRNRYPLTKSEKEDQIGNKVSPNANVPKDSNTSG